MEKRDKDQESAIKQYKNRSQKLYDEISEIYDAIHPVSLKDSNSVSASTSKDSFDVKIHSICDRFADLEMDFNYVKELNTMMSLKYQELMDCFPTSREMQIVIEFLEDKVIEKTDFGYNTETREKRLVNIRKFKSALVALEAQDHNKIPEKYEDIDREEKSE